MQFADFNQLRFDQIVNFAAKCRYRWERPSHGGARAFAAAFTAGPSFAESRNWFVRTPGLKVVRRLPRMTPRVIKSAIRDNDPVIFFEHKGLYRDQGGVPPRIYRAHRQSQSVAKAAT